MPGRRVPAWGRGRPASPPVPCDRLGVGPLRSTFMFERSTNPEVVARAVLLAERLADRLKRPPTDPTADRDKVRAAVAEERAKLAGVSGPTLFEQIADMDRRRRIEHGS